MGDCLHVELWRDITHTTFACSLPVQDKFLESLFLYDEDGHQSYCTICCSGGTLFICESPDCTR